MTPKIVDTTTSCKECPNRIYDSGRIYTCRLVGQHILPEYEHQVAPFCPLPDYPAAVIAGMQTTIHVLQKPNAYGLGLALLVHVATKLKVNLAPSARGITIEFKDGKKDRKVFFGTDYITKYDPHRSEITFMGEGKAMFRISPDSDPPVLWEKSDPDPQKDGWYEHKLR